MPRNESKRDAGSSGVMSNGSQTETVRVARQMRFTSLAEIEAKEPVIRDYVRRAIAVEEAGLGVDFAEGRDLPVPGEREEKFAAMPELKAAWEALTPGRRRAYTGCLFLGLGLGMVFDKTGAGVLIGLGAGLLLEYFWGHRA